MTDMSRIVENSVFSVETEEGLGAMVRRSIGRAELDHNLFDPFLLLDEFKVKQPAGFPDHPHRGFETVTYMLSGAVTHEDFLGHEGTINAGDLQWMTAGKGIVHSEMPAGKMIAHGLQLWVNLGKDDKMTDPQYQELLAKDIPEVNKNGIQVKVIAGESLGVKSQVRTRTPTMYLDFKLDKGAKLSQAIPPDWTAFIYVISGKSYFGPSSHQILGKEHYILVLGNGSSVQAENKDFKRCHFVLIAGKPLRQPIVWEGPFVMNTQDEVNNAWNDYTRGKNGFENSKTWNSKIGLDYLATQTFDKTSEQK
ncbi:pirin-like [Ptychodera flava]|uniref:pirin-like n=1 Tax=Ptychodera flava TaxID=63121 RepID=UPI00396AA983